MLGGTGGRLLAGWVTITAAAARTQQQQQQAAVKQGRGRVAHYL